MENEIRRDTIVGSKRFSNYFWAFFLFVGGIGFLLAGLAIDLKINLLFFANTAELVFILRIHFEKSETASQPLANEIAEIHNNTIIDAQIAIIASPSCHNSLPKIPTTS